MSHPNERPHLSRRDFLRRAAVAGVALPGMSAILAACGGGAQSTVNTGGTGGASGSGGVNPYGTGGIAGADYPLARIEAPVTWTIQSDNPVIDSGLPAETGATVRVLTWPYYLAPSVIKAFERENNCKVEITEGADMDKLLAKINSGQSEFDIMFGMNVWAVGRSIAAGLIRPVNMDYIPNLAANYWDQFQSPFYDVESRFTLPYSLWNTGIFWRNDHVKADIAGMANPYDIFWNGAPKDKTHLLNNAQDLLSLAMFWRGNSDINNADAATLAQAKDDIAQVVQATNAQFDHIDYTDVPKGQAYLHQSWSGNVSDAFVFLPKGDQALNLSYYWPGHTDGVPGNVDNDCIMLLSGGKAPVLSHMLANYVMDAKNAYTNYTTWTGFQMPLKSFTPELLVGNAVVPEHLSSTVVTEDDFKTGFRELELPTDQDAAWQSAYAQLEAGV
jgi:spermidine/putrescine transport system substrate-binding protein